MLSLKVYGHIATLLRQVEQGAPWPRSATHARVVFLEKIGGSHRSSHELQAADDYFTVVPMLGNHEVRKHGALDSGVGVT